MPLGLGEEPHLVDHTLRAVRTTAIGPGGWVVAPMHISVDVGATTTVIIAANPERKWLLLVNDSDTPIWVNLGAPAVAHEGIRINANGGNLELSAAQDCLYLGAVDGIHEAAGDKVCLVTEGV